MILDDYFSNNSSCRNVPAMHTIGQSCWGPGKMRNAESKMRGTHADEYAQWRYTKTNTNPNPDPNRYRRRCPDLNARIQTFMRYVLVHPLSFF